MTETKNQAVTKSTKPGAVLKNLLEGEQFKDALAKSLPSHLKPDRFVRIAMTALTRTPKLMECEQASFFQCLLTLSQLGIEPDGRRAHLIPFKNTKRGVVECQLIIDYKGLAELAMRSGVVSNLHADLICENDQFEYNLGEVTKHVIDFRKPRGKAYAVYSLCRFKDGSQKFEVMTREDVEDIRARSKAADSGPWVSDWAEMAKKTVFRRLSKWLPLSPEYRDALDVDADTVEEKAISGRTARI
jgi:recombination protein RecT